MMHAAGVPVSVKLDPEVRQRMKRLAESRARTPHWLMRDAILQYLEREEARDKFLQEARGAWREYRETGLHATDREVLDWLATWGGDPEAPAPACHE